MRHDWFDPRKPSGATLIAAPVRRCRNCGKEQTQVTTTWYMRIEGRRWEPLVGRCKPKGKR